MSVDLDAPDTADADAAFDFLDALDDVVADFIEDVIGGDYE